MYLMASTCYCIARIERIRLVDPILINLNITRRACHNNRRKRQTAYPNRIQLCLQVLCRCFIVGYCAPLAKEPTWRLTGCSFLHRASSSFLSSSSIRPDLLLFRHDLSTSSTVVHLLLTNRSVRFPLSIHAHATGHWAEVRRGGFRQAFGANAGTSNALTLGGGAQQAPAFGAQLQLSRPRGRSRDPTPGDTPD